LSQSLQGAGGVGGLLAMVQGDGAYTYSYDGNGNVGQMLDGAEVIAAHYEYDPFGNTVNAVGLLADENSYRFSTKYYDTESGLYYYGIRYYIPELGRWLTKDPIAELGGLNLYVFVTNNPISFIDPFGKEANSAAKARLISFAQEKGLKVYSAASQTADVVNRAIFFPLLDLLALPDEIVKCIFGVTDEELMVWAVQFPGGYDDVFLGVVVGGGKAPKIVRKLLGYGLNGLPGPRLTGKVADTFTDGKYFNRQLQTNETFYKYHGVDNRTGKKVSWFTNQQYVGENELRSGLAIRKDWGVDIQSVSKFDVPKGTWVSEGKAASQGADYPGGDYQAVIQNVPKTWVQNTTEVFP
jgi:RHS repeat-associated protein